jgi:hypothetical protein
LKTQGDNQSTTAQVILEGKQGDDTLVRGVYPSSGPSRNGAIVTQSGYLFFDQDQANELAHALWRQDNRQLKGITLRLPNYRVLEPAFEEYATVILLTAENTRGINWDNVLNGDQGREVVTKGASITFNEGALMVTYDFAVSVHGAHGVSWDVLDPAPVLQWCYGYGQAAETPVALLLDTSGDRLLDSDGVLLRDSL